MHGATMRRVVCGQLLMPDLRDARHYDTKNIDGLAGQNSKRPSEKIFNFHFIVKALGTYYDPSYGVTYTGPRGFETAALEGFAGNFRDGARMDGVRTFVKLRAREVNATPTILFIPKFSN